MKTQNYMFLVIACNLHKLHVNTFFPKSSIVNEI